MKYVDGFCTNIRDTAEWTKQHGWQSSDSDTAAWIRSEKEREHENVLTDAYNMGLRGAETNTKVEFQPKTMTGSIGEVRTHLGSAYESFWKMRDKQYADRVETALEATKNVRPSEYHESVFNTNRTTMYDTLVSLWKDVKGEIQGYATPWEKTLLGAAAEQIEAAANKTAGIPW